MADDAAAAAGAAVEEEQAGSNPVVAEAEAEGEQERAVGGEEGEGNAGGGAGANVGDAEMVEAEGEGGAGEEEGKVEEEGEGKEGKEETGAGEVEEAGVQGEGLKEEEGYVTEGSEKADVVNDGGGEWEEEGAGGGGGDEPKRRPGRPKKLKEEGETEVKTPRESSRGRPRPKKEPKEATPFAADRPTRERKSIERFIASAEKDKIKELEIKQGSGTALKDIPNVAYKLSKTSKHDEVLSMLHSLLFNKRGKAAVLKLHILQFSGYVWGENEEKERTKVKEKLERYTKEGLVLIVDVLDLHLSRTGRKEELVTKVLEFLEKPHKTTDTLLELKEQERKSSGKRSSSASRAGRPKIQKVEGKSSRKRERKKVADDGASDESGKDSDNESLEEEIENKRLTFKEDTDHEEDSGEEEQKPTKKSGKKTTKQETEENDEEEGGREEEEEALPARKKAKVAAHDIPLKSPSKPVDKVYSKNRKTSSEKVNKVDEPKKKPKEKDAKTTPAKKSPGRPRKSPGTSGKKEATQTKNSTKSATKDKDSSGNKSSAKERKRKSNKIPSDEKLQEEIRELLKDADFSKVTFTDVVTQLEVKFGVTLVEQKAHVKKLIKEEISKLAEAGDDESEQEAEVVAAAKDDEKDEEEEEQDNSKSIGSGAKEDAEQPAQGVGGD